MDPNSVLKIVREQNRYINDSFNTQNNTYPSEDLYYRKSEYNNVENYIKNGTASHVVADKTDMNSPYERNILVMKSNFERNFQNQFPSEKNESLNNNNSITNERTNNNINKSNASLNVLYNQNKNMKVFNHQNETSYSPSLTNMALQKQHVLKSSNVSNLNYSFGHQKDSLSRSASVKSVASDSGIGSASPLSDCSDIPMNSNNNNSHNFHRIAKVQNSNELAMSQQQQKIIHYNQHLIKSSQNGHIKDAIEYQKMAMARYPASPLYPNSQVPFNQDNPQSLKRKMSEDSSNTQQHVIYNNHSQLNNYNRITPNQQELHSEYTKMYGKTSMAISPMHSYDSIYKNSKPIQASNHPTNLNEQNRTMHSSENFSPNIQHSNHYAKSIPVDSQKQQINISPMYSKNIDYSSFPQPAYQQYHQLPQQYNHQTYHQQNYQQHFYQQSQRSFLEQDKTSKIIQPPHINKMNSIMDSQRYPTNPSPNMYPSYNNEYNGFTACNCSYPDCKYNKVVQNGHPSSTLPLVNPQHKIQQNTLTYKSYVHPGNETNLTRVPEHAVKSNTPLPAVGFTREHQKQSTQSFYHGNETHRLMQQQQYSQKMPSLEPFHTSQPLKKANTNETIPKNLSLTSENSSLTNAIIYNNQAYNNGLQKIAPKFSTVNGPPVTPMLSLKVLNSPLKSNTELESDQPSSSQSIKNPRSSEGYIVISDSELDSNNKNSEKEMRKFKRPRVFENSQTQITTIVTPDGGNLKLKKLPKSLKQQTRKLVEKYKSQKRVEMKLSIAQQHAALALNKNDSPVKIESNMYADNLSLISQAKKNVPTTLLRNKKILSPDLISPESNTPISSSPRESSTCQNAPLVIAPISTNNKTASIVCLSVDSMNEYGDDIELGEIVKIDKIKNSAAFDLINTSDNSPYQNQAARYEINPPNKQPIQEVADENTKEIIDKPVTLSKKILPIVTPRIQDWLEKCAEFVNETSLKNKIDLAKLLRLLDITWPRLLITFMIENNFNFFVTKDSNQICRIQAKYLEIRNLKDDQVKEKAILESELIAIDKSLPKEHDAIQLHNIIVKGNEFNLNSKQFEELRRLIMFKEGSKENPRFHEIYLDSQKKLHSILETTHSSNIFPKILLFLPTIYAIKTEIIENLFCSNFIDSINVRELFRKRFETLLKI